MGAGRYDVIVVGARVAGAATAMLLARQGLRVLAVDRVSFPSDTISSHQLQVPGAALLHRWGLLGKLTAAGTPPARRVRFDAGGGLVMDGQFPAYDGVDALYSPRRTLLDSVLVEAAREAGAEIRENFRVTQVTAWGDRVTGIRGSARGRPAVTETASLVIGADGKRSLVAGAVGARRYRERPVRSFASYSYWAGVPVSGGELYQRPGRAVAVFPTNGELTMVYAAAPVTEFASARADLEGHYLRTLDLCGDLGERVRSGSRAERLRTTPDQPNTFRWSYGPGWALAGDAGVVMDSVSAQGMTNALRGGQLPVRRRCCRAWRQPAAGRRVARPSAPTRPGHPRHVRLHPRPRRLPPGHARPAPLPRGRRRRPAGDRPVSRRVRRHRAAGAVLHLRHGGAHPRLAGHPQVRGSHGGPPVLRPATTRSRPPGRRRDTEGARPVAR
jgi:2-polyprenyl-6-methoxyphenol hydroxylase-like FAD-dependent oxidoreductase